MKIYDLKKTAAATAKRNGLTTAKHNKTICLYDFSIVDTMEISDKDKEGIKTAVLNNDFYYSSDSVYYGYNNDFETTNANIYNTFIAVFDKESGKRLYCIIRPEKISYFHGECKTIYDRYYNENQKEIEINGRPYRTDAEI